MTQTGPAGLELGHPDTIYFSEEMADRLKLSEALPPGGSIYFYYLLRI